MSWDGFLGTARSRELLKDRRRNSRVRRYQWLCNTSHFGQRIQAIYFTTVAIAGYVILQIRQLNAFLMTEPPPDCICEPITTISKATNVPWSLQPAWDQSVDIKIPLFKTKAKRKQMNSLFLLFLQLVTCSTNLLDKRPTNHQVSKSASLYSVFCFQSQFN